MRIPIKKDREGTDMSLDCKQVIEYFSLHQHPDLSNQEKIKYRRHLLECQVCQNEYEEMLHTAAVLESIPDPVPPPELVERIQTQIRQTRRRSILDFLVNPIARILVAMKLGPHPTFVNYTAMLFYLMLTIFMVKLTFFNSTEPPPVELTRPLSPQVRIVRLADVKHASLKAVRIEKEESNEIPIQSTPSDF